MFVDGDDLSVGAVAIGGPVLVGSAERCGVGPEEEKGREEASAIISALWSFNVFFRNVRRPSRGPIPVFAILTPLRAMS